MNEKSSTTRDTSRPVRLRVRPDLVFRSHRDSGSGPRWTVKDPVSLNYFQLGDEERFLLQELDGKTSLERLKLRFEKRYAPQTVSLPYLMGFCGQLHTNGLVLAEANKQGDALLERRQKERANRLLQAPFSLLSIRLPAFNARRVLDALEPVGRVLFHPFFVAIAFLVVMLALAMMIGQSEQILARLPAAQEFLGVTNLTTLLLCLGLVKVLHELGHGLACRHFGGECNSIGLMLLVFSPCLYCDVSDAWMIRNKMQRIAISAAGMYVELLLATMCVFLWMFTISPSLSAFFLNIIVICSISTVLFNGNPLLRYDGYYILSDAIDAPNLYGESRRALWRPLKNWLFRPAPTRVEDDPTDYRLLLYALFSTIYRVFILCVILWAVYKTLDTLHFRPVGDSLVALVLIGLCVPFVLFCGQVWKSPFQRKAFRWGRLGLLASGIALVLTAFVVVPFPRYLEAPLLIQAKDATSVYAGVAGTLVEGCEEGTVVAEGQVIARLENLDLDRRLVQLEGEARELALHVANLRLQANQSRLLLAEIPTAKAALADVSQQVAAVRQDISRLTITSPSAGTVIPAPNRDGHRGRREIELTGWSGTPLLPANRNCFLEEGDAICSVGDPVQLETVLIVHQADVDSVRIGARVKMRLNQSPGRTWIGRVAEIARGEVDHVPAALVSATQVAVEMRGPQQGRPLETSYFVRVRFDEQPAQVRHGSCGIAKIVTDYETLAGRVARLLGRAFRFRL